MTKFPDYYRLLGVMRDTDPEEIRDAFLLRWREMDSPLKGERVFIRHLGAPARKRDLLLEAYTVLSSPALRRHYEHAAGLGAGCGGPKGSCRMIRAMFREGCRQLVLREYDQAARILQRALRHSPENPNLLNYVAFSLIAGGRRTELARSYLERSLSLDPARAESHLLLAWMMQKGGASKGSTRIIENARNFMIHDAPLHLRLKQILAESSPVEKPLYRRSWERVRSFFLSTVRFTR